MVAGIGDLERSIARLCASSLGAFGRDNAAVVLYEDAARRKVQAFLSVLRGLEKLQASPSLLYCFSALPFGNEHWRQSLKTSEGDHSLLYVDPLGLTPIRLLQ